MHRITQAQPEISEGPIEKMVVRMIIIYSNVKRLIV